MLLPDVPVPYVPDVLLSVGDVLDVPVVGFWAVPLMPVAVPVPEDVSLPVVESVEVPVVVPMLPVAPVPDDGVELLDPELTDAAR